MNKRLIRLCLTALKVTRSPQMVSFLAQGKNHTVTTVDSLFRPLGVNGGFLIVTTEDLFNPQLQAPEHDAYTRITYDRDLLQKVAVIRSFVTSGMSDENMLSKLCLDVAFEVLSSVEGETVTFAHLYLFSLGLMQGQVYSSGTFKALMERTRYIASALTVTASTPSAED